MRHAELQRGHRQENGNCNTCEQGNLLNAADPVGSKTFGRRGGAPDRPDLRSRHGTSTSPCSRTWL